MMIPECIFIPINDDKSTSEITYDTECESILTVCLCRHRSAMQASRKPRHHRRKPTNDIPEPCSLTTDIQNYQCSEQRWQCTTQNSSIVSRPQLPERKNSFRSNAVHSMPPRMPRRVESGGNLDVEDSDDSESEQQQSFSISNRKNEIFPKRRSNRSFNNQNVPLVWHNSGTGSAKIMIGKMDFNMERKGIASKLSNAYVASGKELRYIKGV